MQFTPPPPVGPTTAVRWQFVGDSLDTSLFERPVIDLGGSGDTEIRTFGGVAVIGQEHVLTTIGIDDVKSLDPLYDPITDAWLFATAYYDVIGPGKADLFLQIARIGIAGGGQHSSQIQVVFGDGSDPPLNGEENRQMNSLSPDGSILVGDFAARLVTGSPTSISQQVDTPSETVDLVLQSQFLTSTGELEVFLDGTSLGKVMAPETPDGRFATARFSLDNELLGREAASLQFTLDGPTGSTVLLNNISFPTLTNGDFQTGDLSGWDVIVFEQGVAETLAFTVPEPPCFALLVIGLVCCAVSGSMR
jgi:hypothetical protein